MTRHEEASKMRCLLQVIYNVLCESSIKELIANDLCTYPLEYGEDMLIYEKLKELVNKFEKGE